MKKKRNFQKRMERQIAIAKAMGLADKMILAQVSQATAILSLRSQVPALNLTECRDILRRACNARENAKRGKRHDN